MTDVLLGFYNTNAKFTIPSSEVSDAPFYTVKYGDLVPVRLRSESVSLRWLEDWCKEKRQLKHIDTRTKAYNLCLNELLQAVRGQAEDGKE